MRSDLKQHQLDPNLAQNREGWRKAIVAIDPGQGYNRQRYAKVRIQMERKTKKKKENIGKSEGETTKVLKLFQFAVVHNYVVVPPFTKSNRAY